LRSLKIGEDDEIITTPMTAFATVLAVQRARAKTVLADIDPTTAMLSPDSVSRCINRRTKAILLVHLYGQAGPLGELLKLAREHGLQLLEDCAQAHGAKWQGRSVGSIGTFGAWSFYPTKNLGAIGDAGALSTTSRELADRARSLRNYGQSVRYHHPIWGMNSRLDELQAALLRERLRYLESWTDRRRAVAADYRAGIHNSAVSLMSPPAEIESHVYHLFVVTCALRERLQQHLKAAGVESLIHYPIPIHLQEPCRELARDPHGLPYAERHADQCLSLPCHPWLTRAEIQQVIDAVNEFTP
jgi:dTDP-4-amino-4,6-dideoxygalactose transaminase